jgi:hypothetical protein
MKTKNTSHIGGLALFLALGCTTTVYAANLQVARLDAVPDGASLRQAMAAARHRIEKDDSGRLRGYNRGQRLRAEFTPTAAWLEHPEAGRFALALASIRRGQTRQQPAAVTPVAAGPLVEYRRGPGLVEWWNNGPSGLEQGFTLSEKPTGAGALELSLRLDGGLEAAQDHAGGASLSRDGRAVLRYSGLRAWDASGRELPSRMEAARRSIRLIVDDGGARYPVTVDPVVQEFTLTADDGSANDQFGHAVSISNDTVVVGAPLDDTPAGAAAGSVYVFVRNLNGWMLEAKLNASDGKMGDQFGASVAIGGNTIVVGAWSHDVGSAANNGAAYVFVRTASDAWTQQAKLLPSDGRRYAEFGRSVAINGETAVVGAPGQVTKLDSNSGAAYVFVRGPGGWRQETRLTPRTYETQQFGWSVAVFGNRAMVGAPAASPLGAAGTPGAVYVFLRTSGTWQEQDWWRGDQYSERFGHSVAISGDTYLIGAPGYTHQNHFGGGAAITIYPHSFGFHTRKVLLPSDPQSDDNFGYSVALDGPNALIGAYRDDTTTGNDSGSAYVFVRNGDYWSEQAHLFAAGSAAGDQFGHSVAVGGGTYVAGAPLDDTRLGLDAGSVGIFRSGTSTPVTISSNPAGRSFTVSGLGCEPGTYAAGTILNWMRGSYCTVTFASPQNGVSGTRYVFASWADGSTSATRTFTVPGTATTYTAGFTTQYRLSTSVVPLGAGTVAGGGYYNAGTAATVSVTSVKDGYRFLRWTGPVAAPISATTTVAMTGPQSVAANFQIRTTTSVSPVSGFYGHIVTLTARIGPFGVFTGMLQFQVAGANVGSPIAVTGAGTYTMQYAIKKPLGSYPITVHFTSSTELAASSTGTSTLTVTHTR